MTPEAGARQEIRVLSALPGRLRVRHVGRRRGLEELETLRDSLQARPEVDAVELNPRTGSLLVFYDPGRVSSEDLRGALSEVGLDLAADVEAARGQAGGTGRVMGAAEALNRRVIQASGGTDLRLLVPMGLGALSARQALRNTPRLGQAPWYLLAWYAFDSFLKLNRPQGRSTPSTRGETRERRGDG